MGKLWVVRNDKLDRELLDGGFVSIGWEQVGDLNRYRGDWAALKTALLDRVPEAKKSPRSVPMWALSIRRFESEVQKGDLVISAYKRDSRTPPRTLNFGVVTGDYRHYPDAPEQPNRRAVRWLTIGVRREELSRGAVGAISRPPTVYPVDKYREDFLSYFQE